MRVATLRYLLFTVLAAAVGSCGSPPVQHEPELHPHGNGVKSLQVNCAARAGDRRFKNRRPPIRFEEGDKQLTL